MVRRVLTWSLTRPVSRTVRLSTGYSVGAPGLFRVDADTAPLGSEDTTPGSRACVCACSSWPGRAGRPPGRVLARLTFPLAVLGALFACSAPSGRGLPRLWLLLCFFFPCCAPVVSCLACFPTPVALGLGVLSPPPPFFCPLPPLCAPRCLPLFVFCGLGCLGPQPLVAPPPPPPPFFCPPSVILGVSCFPAALGLCAPPLFFLVFFFFPLFPFFWSVGRCGAGSCVSGR